MLATCLLHAGSINSPVSRPLLVLKVLRKALNSKHLAGNDTVVTFRGFLEETVDAIGPHLEAKDCSAREARASYCWRLITASRPNTGPSALAVTAERPFQLVLSSLASFQYWPSSRQTGD